jgi:protease-4
VIKEKLRKKARSRKFLVIVIVVILSIGWLLHTVYLYINQIVVVTIEGPIIDFREIVTALREAKDNPNVKAVILYLNTPGGLAVACLEIADYVESLAEVKPVIAIMGFECASGGYYIASFANRILTHRNTVTGGIGVIAIWVDLTKYYEKQGIKIWVWSTGKEKDFGAPWRSPTEEEKAKIESEVKRLSRIVLDDIQENRDLEPEIIKEIETGKIIYGYEAVEMGLADRIGDFHSALELVANMTKLWKYLIVTPDLDSRQRFFKALIGG